MATPLLAPFNLKQLRQQSTKRAMITTLMSQYEKLTTKIKPS